MDEIMFDEEMIQIECFRSDNKPDKAFSMPIFEVRDVDVTNRTSKFEISNIKLDAHRSIVNTRRLDLTSRYSKNPIVLFSHDSRLGIGTSSATQYKDGQKTVVESIVKFGKNRFAQEVMENVNDGIFRGASIGFIPKLNFWDEEAKNIFEEDFKDMGLKAPERLMWYIREAELMEWSIVAIPSNPETLKKNFGAMSPDLQRMVLFEQLKERVPVLIGELESMSKKQLENDNKIQEIFDKFEKMNKPETKAVEKTDSVKSEVIVSKESFKSFLEWKANQLIMEQINYEKGIV